MSELDKLKTWNELSNYLLSNIRFVPMKPKKTNYSEQELRNMMLTLQSILVKKAGLKRVSLKRYFSTDKGFKMMNMNVTK